MDCSLIFLIGISYDLTSQWTNEKKKFRVHFNNGLRCEKRKYFHNIENISIKKIDSFVPNIIFVLAFCNKYILDVVYIVNLSLAALINMVQQPLSSSFRKAVRQSDHARLETFVANLYVNVAQMAN